MLNLFYFLIAKFYSLDHHKYEDHDCPEKYRADAQVPICPLCDKPVPSKRGEAPDLAVNQHMENNCQNKKKKVCQLSIFYVDLSFW